MIEEQTGIDRLPRSSPRCALFLTTNHYPLTTVSSSHNQTSMANSSFQLVRIPHPQSGAGACPEQSRRVPAPPQRLTGQRIPATSCRLPATGSCPPSIVHDPPITVFLITNRDSPITAFLTTNHYPLTTAFTPPPHQIGPTPPILQTPPPHQIRPTPPSSRPHPPMPVCETVKL